MSSEGITFRPEDWKTETALTTATAAAQLAAIVLAGVAAQRRFPTVSIWFAVLAAGLFTVVIVQAHVLVREATGDLVSTSRVRVTSGLPEFPPTHVAPSDIHAVRVGRTEDVWYVDLERRDGVELRLYHSGTTDSGEALARATAVADLLEVATPDIRP
jgi:hypothetical protein